MSRFCAFILVVLVGCGDAENDDPQSVASNNQGATNSQVDTNNTATNGATNSGSNSNNATTPNNSTNNQGSTNNQTNTGGCLSEHPRVGHSLQLSTKSHGVKGSATIIDDCTIAIEGFSFDGGGVDVRFYGGLGGNYEAGFAMTENLVGTVFNNQSLNITLPAERTLDDLDGLSVWCYDFTVSFGDGLFQ